LGQNGIPASVEKLDAFGPEVAEPAIARFVENGDQSGSLLCVETDLDAGGSQIQAY
jgi:hypothetical protein